MVSISQRTRWESVTKTSQVMLFKEIRPVYSANYRNHLKKVNTCCGQNSDHFFVNTSGTYSEHVKRKLSAYFYSECIKLIFVAGLYLRLWTFRHENFVKSVGNFKKKVKALQWICIIKMTHIQDTFHNLF